MICPECGATNRDAASYCDSCGKPIAAGVPPRWETVQDAGSDDGSSEPLLGSGGLVGWMAFGWFLRFATLAVAGVCVGVVTLFIGMYAYSAFFFILGIVGIVGTRYLLKADR